MRTQTEKPSGRLSSAHKNLAVRSAFGRFEGVLKLALIQMRVTGGEAHTNLARAEQRIAQAVAEGANTILLPEAMNLGWTHRSARTAAEEIPNGASCRHLSAAARRHSVFVCAGLIERAGEFLFNSAVLFAPNGELLLHHRKLNELAIAHDVYAAGDRLAVVATPLGRIGLMICSDGFAENQIVSRTLGLMGADLILSPCAWAVPADHDNAREPYGQLWLEHYGPVARAYGLWIAGCSNVGPVEDGPWQGRICIGCSLVVAPDGQPALRGPYGVDAEAVLHLDVPLALSRKRTAHHP